MCRYCRIAALVLSSDYPLLALPVLVGAGDSRIFYIVLMFVIPFPDPIRLVHEEINGIQQGADAGQETAGDARPFSGGDAAGRNGAAVVMQQLSTVGLGPLAGSAQYQGGDGIMVVGVGTDAESSSLERDAPTAGRDVSHQRVGMAGGQVSWGQARSAAVRLWVKARRLA